MALKTVAEWSESVGISRQAGAKAVARCGIVVRNHLVDADEATRLYRERTRPRMNEPRGPKAARRQEQDALADTEQQLRRACELGLVAAAALQSGHFSFIEADLRAAIAVLRPLARERLAFPISVWDALTGNVGAVLEPDVAGDAMSDEEVEAMGNFWSSVAAGDVRIKVDPK